MDSRGKPKPEDLDEKPEYFIMLVHTKGLVVVKFFNTCLTL